MRSIIFIIVFCYFISNHSVGLEKNNFLSTKYDEVNIRNGPGKKYFIIATLKKKGLPVKVLSTFDSWVHIIDFEGMKGWISISQLSKKKYGILTKELSILRSFPSDKSKKIAKLNTFINFEVSKCRMEWCKIKLNGKSGWLKKKDFWGVDQNFTD